MESIQASVDVCMSVWDAFYLMLMCHAAVVLCVGVSGFGEMK